MCEVMKTKSTYWSVIRSLVATIVAVMGFAMASVGQSWTIDVGEQQKISFPDGKSFVTCSSDKWYCRVHGTDANNAGSIIVKKDGVSYTSFNLADGDYTLTRLSWSNVFYGNIFLKDNSGNLKDGWVVVERKGSGFDLYILGTKPECGPTVPDITDGSSTLSSVCLNNDDARNSITIDLSAVVGAAAGAGHQGWTFIKDDETKNTTLTLANIKNPANMAEYDGKTLYYWAEDDNGTLGYSNGVTLNVCSATVGDIAGGAASVCINSTGGRASLTVPSITNSVVEQGWTVTNSPSDITLESILDPANFDTYDGSTLKYWAKTVVGAVSYSNGVTLSVCKPTVGNIANGAKRICLNANSITVPTVDYPAGASASNYTKGWEIVETGETFATISGANTEQILTTSSGEEKRLSYYYGKTIRYWVKDQYDVMTYSNSVILMSQPTVTIDLEGSAPNNNVCTRNFEGCAGEKITSFPSVSYDANGTKINVAKWYIGNSSSGSLKWEEYKNQVIDPEGTKYTHLYYAVIPSQQDKVQCSSASILNTKTNLIRKTTDVEIEFNPALESSYLCSDGANVIVKKADGSNITEEVHWTKNGNLVSNTTTNQYNYTFDCDEESGNVTLGAYIKAPNGCRAEVSQAVTIRNDFDTYIYNGPTGESSNVCNANNWVKLNVDGTTDLSVHPVSDFSSAGCRYVINTDGVELLAGQTWTVSGHGSKIVVGDGNWTNKNNIMERENSGLESAFTMCVGNGAYGVTTGYYEYMKACTNANWNVYKSAIAAYDYRKYAKEFKISGTLNVGENDGVVIDVKEGSTLTIASETGNFELGKLAQDRYVEISKNATAEGVVNGYNYAVVIPGSSVSYTGIGCSKIRSGKYSQLYIANANVSFEDNAMVEIMQSFTPIYVNSNQVNPNGSTIKFIGNVNQKIPRFNYYNLVLGNASKKTIGGETTLWVRNSLIVEASTTLQLSQYVSNDGSIKSAKVCLYGSGTTAFVNNGHVACGPNTTVGYYSTNPTVIAPIYYGNLDLSLKKRIFSTEGVTGISGTLSLGSAVCTTMGSIIEFNGTGAQTIPELEYHNLVINNSGLDGNKNDQVSLGGDIVVNNQLSLVEGILNTNGGSLTIANKSASAIGQGYRYKSDSASYIIGTITRNLPSNLSGMESYVFPVGTDNRYLPLSMSQITAENNASVSVGVTNSVNSTSYTSPLTAVDNNAYWKINGTNYLSSSVSVSSSNGLGTSNTLGFEADGDGSFVNVVGCSVSDNAICASSIVNGSGTIALATRNINAKTYYYNCNKMSGNPSSLSSWNTARYGTSGEQPSSFEEDDATWIFDCGATISDDLVISGSNTKVYFNVKSGDVLTINADVTLPIVEHRQGKVKIEDEGNLTLLNSFTMADVNGTSYAANRCTITNEGKLNIYNSNLVISNGLIENNGEIYMMNVDLQMSSSDWWGSNKWSEGASKLGRFVNNGTVRMYNGELWVKGGNSNATNLWNKENAVWLVDNSASPYKKVKFDDVEFRQDSEGEKIRYVYFECGSSFVVKGSDVEVYYRGNGDGCRAYLEGEFVVYDGNLYVRRTAQGGGNFTVKACGKVYLIDTDGSKDGVFMVDGSSGWQVNVEGSLYAVGILNKSDGSGNKFNVADSAQIFVGDIGVTSSSQHSWEFSLDVQEGGTMNYCGNRTSGSDAIGKNEGTLNYAGSFYQDSDPKAQGDVGGPGTQTIMYVDGTECMADYKNTVNGNLGHIILPVELTMLYGICKNGNVELHWQTATESNNEGFVILRSFDGVNFVEIAEVMGAGTSTETINYMYIDEDDKTGMVYYKLRQVDFDGKTKESKIVAVQTCGPNAQFAIAENEITVSFKNPEETNYVVVTSLSGKIVFSKSFKDVAEARIASPRIKGVYIISVIDSKQITSEKFIK